MIPGTAPDPVPGRVPDLVAELAEHDPEQAVLVAAVREATTMPGVHDEVRLAALANWHRLEGLLARVLPSRRVGSDDLHEHLTAARDATERRWDRLHQRLADLAGAWSDAAIPVTLLKGAALVEAGVVPAGERPMADLDVLVDASVAARAHAIAGTAGFHSRASGDTWEYAATRHHHLPVLDDGHGTTLEVHHRLLDGTHPQRRLDAAIRTRSVPLGGTDLRRLDEVASWLHLAVHFWDDRRRGTGGPLLQLRDLHLVLGRLDPDELVDLAGRVGATRLVSTVAAVLEAVVGSSRAPSVRRSLGGPAPGDDHVADFVGRRIMGRRSPVAQLVQPTVSVAYTPWRLATRTRRQLWPGPDLVRQVHGPDATARDHLASLAPVARDGLATPGVVWRDLRLDRWAHGVAREVDAR